MKQLQIVKQESELVERELEKQIRSILEGIPEVASQMKVWRNLAPSDPPFDIRVNLTLLQSQTKVELWIECKSLPRPALFPYTRLESRLPKSSSKKVVIPVLAAPHISPRMADLCQKHGWGWYDLAGNCRLSIPGPIYIERTGFKSVHQPPTAKANLGTAAAAQVLRALLISDHAGMRWSQTALQAACKPGVSIGLVNKVVTHLREESWLTSDIDGRFFVSDPAGLMQVWEKAYRFDQHRQLSYFTLLRGKELEGQLATLMNSQGQAAYAAFSAAELDVPNVRQNKTWLYVNEAALDDFEQMAKAKRVESGANMTVLIPEDDGVFYGSVYRQNGSLGRTNPVQTWLDLKQMASRGEEAAEALMEQCLKPEWKTLSHV